MARSGDFEMHGGVIKGVKPENDPKKALRSSCSVFFCLASRRVIVVPFLIRMVEAARQRPSYMGFVGDWPNTVLESTISNTELSEIFWPSPSSRDRAQ